MGRKRKKPNPEEERCEICNRIHPPGRVKTQPQLAKHLGVSTHAIHTWRKDGMPGPPIGDKGEYDIEEVRKWRADTSLRDPTRGQRPEDKSEDRRRLNAASALEKEARAKIAQAKADKMLGDLVARESVEQLLSQFFTEARRQVKKIPLDMATGYPEEFRQRLIDDMNERLDLYLRSMAGWVSRVAEIEE